MVSRDVGMVILEVIRKHSPEGSQQAIAKAHRQWRDHATFRDRLYKSFHVGASQRSPTEPGASLLTAFATGKASPSERAFVRDYKRTLGVEWPPEPKP